MSKNIILISVLLLQVFSFTFSKETAESGLIFNDYGSVVKVSNRDIPLKANFTYKVAFDVGSAAEDVGQINRNINSVARFINMHAINGVALEKMQIAVVLHGSATRDGLTHQAYKQRNQINNPTLELIEQLNAKGVKFYQCGQSADHHKVTKEELAEPVQLALSAMTILTELQADGFQRLP